MPFTPSHIAAVLPLCAGRPSRRLVPSALVIGSMVPDLAYFVPSRLRPPVLTAVLSHSLIGVVTLDLVSGLLIWLVWRLLLRAPVVDLLPGWVRRRLPGPRELAPTVPRPGELGWVALSVAVGALTHVVWDGFTHQGRWATRHLVWLNLTVADLPVYKLLQYGSGVFGLVVLALWMSLQLRRRPSSGGTDPDGLSERTRRRLWFVGSALLLAAVGLVWLLEARAAHRLLDERVVVAIATRAITACGVLILGYALGHRLLAHRPVTRAGRTLAGPAARPDDVISKTP